MKNIVVPGLLLFLVLSLLSGFTNRMRNLPKDEGLLIKIDTLASNLTVPWQILFLPDSTMLFTERPGQVRLFRKGKLSTKPILNVDDVKAETKTGLLGMVIHPNFTKNHFIYLAHNYGTKNLIYLRVVRYEFVKDSLIKPKTLIEGIPAARNHTGCRLIFGPDKKLYISAGDADQPALAQDLKTYNGKILRINDDGSVPNDNPFVRSDTAKHEIWTYGHRNPQGLVFQPVSHLLYDSEHGPTGGDEINTVFEGENYGWPTIHHQERRKGMVTPLLEYSPSIGPSEMIFYQGKAFPKLRGNLLVACLRGASILRIPPGSGTYSKQELLLKKKYGRIRSIVEGPDGFIYISTSNFDLPESKGERPFDMILRLRPSKNKSDAVIGERIEPNVKVKTERVQTSSANLFKQLCASCHGEKLEGTTTAKAIKGGNFVFGSDKNSVVKNIKTGIPAKGMPAWNGAISDKNIDELAEYVLSMSR